MDLSGFYYVAVTSLRTFIELMPYLIWAIVTVVFGELRAWGGRRSILRRINRTAIDEISHDRIKQLQKENRTLRTQLAESRAEAHIYQRRLQSAFMTSDWGQEIIDKISRDRTADAKVVKTKTGGKKNGRKTRRVPKSAS